MAEVITDIATGILNLYNAFISALPAWLGEFVNLFLIVLLIFFYAWFVWKFYRFLAKKNILELNLKKYNTSEHPVLTKLVAGGLYLLEYIIIVPFIIFFWFAVFALFLIFLTNSLEIHTVLILSATIVAAVRLAAYYKEDLAKDLGKLLPFTLLAVSILNFGTFFDIQRVIGQLTQLPAFFSQIITYLAFVVLIEIILRFFDFLFSLFGIEEPDEEKEQPVISK
ncbi:hypothetical protein ACFLZJ_00405 [Nanoarchaeota archaeon]